MGCDGGTIPRRDELVKTKQKPEQKDKNAEAIAKWRHCAITQQELKQPIVTCELGRLYNKESVLEYLISKEKNNEAAQHIRNLKDVTVLNLTLNPNFKEKQADKGDEYVDQQKSPYICPIIGIEMNGKYKFVCLWKCGCVFSERALKEIKTDTCTKCGTKYDQSDVVIINPSNDELEFQKKQMEIRRELRKQMRNGKKNKASDPAGGIAKKAKVTATSTSGASSSKSTLITSSNSELSNNSGSQVKLSTKLIIPEKAKPEYSIAKDPKASEALKSLFTSHQSAKSKVKQHWITHNPLFF